MPESPDITVYVEALRPRVVGRVLARVRVRSPHLLRTIDPPIDEVEGRTVAGVERLGKRIVLRLEGDLALVLHLMIAGRLVWKDGGGEARGRADVLSLDFDSGTLVLTEAGTKRRTSLHVMRGEASVRALHAGGVEPLEASQPEFAAALRRENRTLKRALTDPRIVSGVGNAYSDEILHAAGLSPFATTAQLDDAQIARLHAAARRILAEWTDRLRAQVGGRFPRPAEVTAFRPDFAAHGRFGKPCPACGTPIQRVVFAENEMNYCPRCQTGGKVLADRSLSRLLRRDWPRSADELEGP